MCEAARVTRRVTADRKPRRLRPTVVKGFRKKEIETLAKCHLAAGSGHFPMVTGSGPQATRRVSFTWVNTALANINTALAGTCHHISANHAHHSLTSFARRFNRRFLLDTLTERLAYACAQTEPHPYRVITAG